MMNQKIKMKDSPTKQHEDKGWKSMKEKMIHGE